MRYQALTKVLVGAAALLLAATSAFAQTPVKIRMQTAVPSASIYFELLKRYADRIDKMSAGRVKIEVLLRCKFSIERERL